MEEVEANTSRPKIESETGLSYKQETRQVCHHTTRAAVKEQKKKSTKTAMHNGGG